MGRIEHTLLDGDKPPIRPKTAARNHTIPQKVTGVSICALTKERGPGYPSGCPGPRLRGEWLDFDFPVPYDHEVPRRIGEARRQLSPEGVAVLEGIIAETGDLEDVVAAMESLPASDRRVLVGVSRFFAEAYDARMRESPGWADLHRHLAALILRARELDPSLRAGATLGEAIVVLKRHAEPLGISEEVLEMIVDVPEE